MRHVEQRAILWPLPLFEGVSMTSSSPCSRTTRSDSSIAFKANDDPVSRWHQRQWQQCTKSRLLLKATLPPRDIMPSVELTPDRFEYADRLEPDRPVQRDARIVRQRDAGIRTAVTALHERCEQLEVQIAPDPLPMPVRIDIRRSFHRPPVGGAFPMRRRVGVADALSGAFGEQPGPAVQGLVDARAKLLY